MTKKRSVLDLIQIPNPCPADWDEMTGDDKVRYCGTCRKSVYNLSSMTRSQAETLVAASHGQMCARFERLPGGEVQTQAPIPPRPGSPGRRPSPAAAALVTAILGVGPTSAWPNPPSNRAFASQSLSPSDSLTEAASPGSPGAALSGIVKREGGVPVAGARVTVASLDTGVVLATSSAANGYYKFESAAEGSYEMTVSADGCQTSQFSGIELIANRNHQTNVLLKQATRVGLGGDMVLPPQPLRTLYEDSSLIVVGLAAKSIIVSQDEHSYLVKTTVEISETLKGHARRSLISVYHDEMSPDRDLFAADGAPILMFLSHRKSEGVFSRSSYEAVSSSFGLKKLSDSAMASYVQHIKSLQTILQEAAPCEADLAEWLVDLAEDAVTRAEAANDLDWRGHDPVLQACGREQTTQPATSATEAAASAPFNTADNEAGPTCAFTVAADLLSPSQKDRVMAIILGLYQITENDITLIRAARQWNDKRLVPFILSRLERMEPDPQPIAASLIAELEPTVAFDTEVSELASDSRAAAQAMDPSDEPADSSDSGTSSPSESEDGPSKEAPVAVSKAEAKLRLADVIRKVVTLVRAKLDLQSSSEEAVSSK